MISNRMFNRWSVLLPISFFLILLCTAKSFDFTEDSVSLSQNLHMETPVSRAHTHSLRQSTKSALPNNIGKAVLWKGLVAIIAVVAAAVLIVKCMRYLKGTSTFISSRRLADGECLGLAGDGDSDGALHSQKPFTGPGINYPVEIDLESMIDPQGGHSQAIKKPKVTKKGKAKQLIVAVGIVAVVLLSYKITQSNASQTTSAATTNQATTTNQSPEGIWIGRELKQLKPKGQGLKGKKGLGLKKGQKGRREREREREQKAATTTKATTTEATTTKATTTKATTTTKSPQQITREQLERFRIEFEKVAEHGYLKMTLKLMSTDSLMPCSKLEHLKNLWNEISDRKNFPQDLEDDMTNLCKDCRTIWADCRSRWPVFSLFPSISAEANGYVNCPTSGFWAGFPKKITGHDGKPVPSITRQVLLTKMNNLRTKIKKIKI